MEINLGQLRRNFEIIRRHQPKPLGLLSVVKDAAYGHGAVPVAQTAVASGADFLGVSNLEEAIELRENRLAAPILVLGERTFDELPYCCEWDLRTCVGRLETLLELNRLAGAVGRPATVHLKIDTGMNRYGVRWTEAPALIERIQQLKWVKLEGVLSHFAMSDELDKTFALLQLSRFRELLDWMAARQVKVKYRHICNSGGFLDLPQAHFDMVRVGILALGVYPSKVCRRLPGLAPVMEVKCRLAEIKRIEPGDTVGYGMRYRAETHRRVGVLPLGYGDGLPRIRNLGAVLVRGRRAPVIGSNAMDATMVDVTDIPEAQWGDEVVLMGRQGSEEISVHDVAQWGQTVSYDILCGWRARLPRFYPDVAP